MALKTQKTSTILLSCARIFNYVHFVVLLLEKKEKTMSEKEHKKSKRGYFEKQLTTSVVRDDGTKLRVTGLSKNSYEEACADARKKKEEAERLHKISILNKKASTTEPFKHYILMFMDYKKNKVATKHRWTSTTYDTNMQIFDSKFRDSKIGNMQLKNLSVNHFQTFYDDLTLNKGLALSYVSNIRLLAIQTFDYIDRNIIKIENYARLADLNSVWRDEVGIDFDEDVEEEKGQVLTEEEISKIYTCIIEEPTRYRYGWAYLLQLATGCRPQEILALTKQCVDFDKKEILINKAIGRKKIDGKKVCYFKTTKNRVIRRVYMDDIMEMALKNILKYMPRNLDKDHRTDLIEQGLLIYNTKGELLNVDIYSGEFKRLCHYVGVDLKFGEGSYALRHTWDSHNNTYKCNNPMQFLITAKVAGHTPNVDVNTYTHVTEQMIRDNIKNPIASMLNEKKEDEEMFKEFLEFKKWQEQMRGEQ